MATDMSLVIFEPNIGAVVVERWLGGRGTLKKLYEVVQRAPDHTSRGYDTWGRITATQAALIAEASYVGGVTPAAITQLSQAFPDDRYWWMMQRDY